MTYLIIFVVAYAIIGFAFTYALRSKTPWAVRDASPQAVLLAGFMWPIILAVLIYNEYMFYKINKRYNDGH